MEPATAPRPSASWVLLTLGDRPESLRRAVDSIRRFATDSEIVVVVNGPRAVDPGPGVDVVVTGENLGVPAGRDLAIRSAATDVVLVLDDDAELLGDVSAAALDAFAIRPDLAAVSFRLVDEDGETAARHVPRPGRGSEERSGDVVGFLGGACAIRRAAYLDAGGYWGDLFYGHEELDLSWRLIDRGGRIRYLAETAVFHPRSAISRHADGWRLTGRNRVMVARRNLPAPILVVHVLVWLVVGSLRAWRDGGLRSYLSGWTSGWRAPVPRSPVSWATVGYLTRAGRPPVI